MIFVFELLWLAVIRNLEFLCRWIFRYGRLSYERWLAAVDNFLCEMMFLMRAVFRWSLLVCVFCLRLFLFYLIRLPCLCLSFANLPFDGCLWNKFLHQKCLLKYDLPLTVLLYHALGLTHLHYICLLLMLEMMCDLCLVFNYQMAQEENLFLVLKFLSFSKMLRFLICTYSFPYLFHFLIIIFFINLFLNLPYFKNINLILLLLNVIAN